MSQISKSICENTCRRTVFEMLGLADNENFGVISNRAYATVVVDDNGVEREVELRAIVRKVNEDGVSGREMFENEVAAYAEQIEEKRAKKEEKEKAKAEKIAKDKAKREAAKAKKEAEEDE